MRRKLFKPIGEGGVGVYVLVGKGEDELEVGKWKPVSTKITLGFDAIKKTSE